MFIRIVLFFLIFLLCQDSYAQEQSKFWIFLTDKYGVFFNPYEYFDTKAIARRQREQISLYDSTDFPLREDYLLKIASSCDSVCGVSRWFNAVACMASDEQIKRMSQWSFVKEIVPMYSTSTLAWQDGNSSPTYDYNSSLSKSILYAQTERMQYRLFRNRGFTGAGVRIAVFDAGFPEVNSHSAFEHMRRNNRIVATYDFVRNKESVFRSNSHGTHVLSCIGGMRDDIPIGCATEAEFLLARTENAFWEVHSEEDNWIRALEWADKNGADIINSSLGYTNEFYFREDMDGKKSILSQAGNMALAKGILVVNSAGNDGNSPWEIIGAPADADSVLSVGGVDPWTGIHTSFSSFGPTSDGRRKPNLTAFSYVMTFKGSNTGTSFSSPLVAGFAACVRQLHPEWTAGKLFKELEKCGELFPYFDYAHGFGIPQASYFMSEEKQSNTAPPLRFELDQETNSVNIIAAAAEEDTTSFYSKKKEWEKNYMYEQPLDYLYWQFKQPDGKIRYYEVVEPGTHYLAKISGERNGLGCVLSVYYRGEVKEYDWENLLIELSKK